MLTVGEGVAEAPIVGGCLTLVAASLGTPYEIETDGCIVMLEDLNEDPYMIDAHLNHLIDAGKFANAAGFVFGTDVNLAAQTIPEYNESTLSIEEVLDELIAPLGIPAVGNIPIGHGKTKVTIPLGAQARLDATGEDARHPRGRRDVSAHEAIDRDFDGHLERIRDFLRIPSVSAYDGDLRSTADAVCELIAAAGGTAAPREPGEKRPTVIGVIDGPRPDRPALRHVRRPAARYAVDGRPVRRRDP